MLTLLGSLIGLGGSFLPKLLEFFQDRQDKAHEIKMLAAQADIQLKLGTQKLEGIEMETTASEMEALYEHAKLSNKTHPIVRAIQELTRPLVTWIFMGMFCFVKYCHVIVVMESGIGMTGAIIEVWDPETKALFAGIMSFWFGSRVFGKKRGA